MSKKIAIPFKSNMLTKNGYINTESLVLKRKFEKILKPVNFKILNNENKLITVTYLGQEDKTIYKVKTLTGNVFYITEDSLLTCLTIDGKIEEKTIKEVSATDNIISKVGDSITDEKYLVSLEDAYLLGYLYAVSFHELIKSKEELIEIPTSNSTFEFIRDLLINKFDVCTENNKVYIYNSDFNIKNYILQNNYNQNQIPNLIKESNSNIHISFLQGFFDVYTIFEKNSIRKEIKNHFFFNDLLLILKNLGIIAEKTNEFIIRGEEVLSFYNIINFRNPSYEEKILDFSLNKEDFYVITSLKKIVNEYFNTIKDNKEELDESFEYTRENIESLLMLNGDKNLKETIYPLIKQNICYDKIISVETFSSQKCIVIELDDNEKIILDSIIIK